MSLGDETREFFEGPFNCAQSVFAPFAQRFSLDMETAAKLATPFGGGMGHAGLVCGAISGALLAIGLAKGVSTYDPENKQVCYDLARIFVKRFKNLHGATTCPGLLDLDIGNPEDLQQAREINLIHTICPDFVGDAADIVGELLGIV